MGDWWIYPIVGVGIAFVTWIFGAGYEEDNDRARVPVSSHDAVDVDRLGERRGERQAFRVDRFHP